MPSYIKHIDDKSANTEFARGYPVNTDQHKIIYSDEVIKTQVGASLRDYIKVLIYDYSGENLIGTTFVEQQPNYADVNFRFKNYDGNILSGNKKILRSAFPLVNGDVILSPKEEIQKLNLSANSYQVVFSFRSDIIGSYEDTNSNLVISEISQSRTEIKVQPENLKNSIKATDVSLNIDYQNFITVSSYINKEYWGLYNLREKVSENMIAAKHDVNPNDVTMLEFDGQIVDGDNTEYLQLRSYIQQNDLSNDENYNHVINQIDINNFMDSNLYG